MALAILRSFGTGYRVGRLLAVVEQVPIAEAVRLAEAGERRYVRIDGRIDSDQEFEDRDHRPLVLRRTSLAWRPSSAAGQWRDLETPTLEVVPFVVREGLDEIGVDGEAVKDGLVVVPRESSGRADELGERAPSTVPPDAPVRLRVEQVSSVEHATVLGVPRQGADGGAIIGAGLGRPLILTTLERDEAMRVLTGGATGRSRLAIACLGLGAILIAAAALWWIADALLGGGVASALAASPDPTLRPGTDTRTTGQPPGFVGQPLFALAGVIVVGLLSVAATLAWVRLTGGSRRSGNGPRR